MSLECLEHHTLLSNMAGPRPRKCTFQGGVFPPMQQHQGHSTIGGGMLPSESDASGACGNDDSGWKVLLASASSDTGQGRVSGVGAGNSTGRGRGGRDSIASASWVPGAFDVLVELFPHRQAVVSKLNLLRNREDAIVRRYTMT